MTARPDLWFHAGMGEPGASRKQQQTIVVAVAGGIFVLAIAVVVPLFVGGAGESTGDRAMDRSFMEGPHIEPRPVHPPRGERKVERSGKGLSVQSEPIVCTGGQIVRTNTRLTITAPRAVLVRGDCRMKLVNVDLKAKDAVVVEGGRLEVVNGSVRADGVALRVTGGTLELTNVDVRGSTALEASGDARVTGKGGSLAASGAAIVARGDAQVALVETGIDGPVARDESARLTVDDGAEGD